MFSAYAVVRIGLIRRIGPISLICIIFLLVFSGIIDLFPIINDSRGSVVNSDKRQDVLFFENHTNPNDIIANSTWFYHSASLAGRAIYSGYTYFTWSYGYDQGNESKNSFPSIRLQISLLFALCSQLLLFHMLNSLKLLKNMSIQIFLSGIPFLQSIQILTHFFVYTQKYSMPKLTTKTFTILSGFIIILAAFFPPLWRQLGSGQSSSS